MVGILPLAPRDMNRGFTAHAETGTTEPISALVSAA